MHFRCSAEDVVLGFRLLYGAFVNQGRCKGRVCCELSHVVGGSAGLAGCVIEAVLYLEHSSTV